MSALSAPQMIKDAKKIVIKIGSSILAGEKPGHLREDWMRSLADDMASLVGEGKSLALVSSGAIALGRHELEMGAGALKLEESQAAAAAGQIHLSRLWHQIFEERGIKVGQILLTLDDTENRRLYLNARATLSTLLEMRAIPLINENDSVATAEIRYGDNDRLAARVAGMMGAECLIMLSSVEGFFSRDPETEEGAELLEEIPEITPAIRAQAGDAKDNISSGGMKTKLVAAQIVTQAGGHMIISDGRILHPLRAILEGRPCSRFPAHATPRLARKRWIAGSLGPKGTLHIDAGALKALRSGKSLLPAGVVKVSGAFSRGDAVLLLDPEGKEVGRGLSAYAAADASRIAGQKSHAIAQILGYRGRAEMIHRNDLVLAFSENKEGE